MAFGMPVISVFLGIVIRIFQGDHNPPHIHVQYGDFRAILEIKSGKVLAGKLPPRVRKIMLEWLKIRRAEILKSWKDAKEFKIPRKVKPLE
jgi:hypothetical protein